ncbi:hypothetical protein K1719_003936 [Acacia pycnantha]|nr:hypothetical protein K1719_003936 [Acacia pycnantha]
MPSAFRSPDFRGDHNETEAIQWLNLHKAMRNGKHLLWFKEWSEQVAFTADLQRAFRDDAGEILLRRPVARSICEAYF